LKTFEQFFHQPLSFPATTSWYLSDLGEARGKQELFARQAPQKLKVLREHTLIESAVSSNRIEGVEVDKARVGTVCCLGAINRVIEMKKKCVAIWTHSN
jgi:hypothetical protein